MEEQEDGYVKTLQRFKKLHLLSSVRTSSTRLGCIYIRKLVACL